MARQAPFFAIILVMAVAMSEAATQTPAHKGKGNVSPVCSASASAWKSKSSCTAFENAICSTAEACPNNYITALELDTFATPLYLSILTTITGPEECQQEVVEETGGLTFKYECSTSNYNGEQKLAVVLTCPPGYYATQSACRDFEDYSFVNKTPTFYGVLDFVVCLITLPGDGTAAQVGVWMGCTNATYPGVSQPISTSTKSAVSAKQWTATVTADRLARP